MTKKKESKKQPKTKAEPNTIQAKNKNGLGIFLVQLACVVMMCFFAYDIGYLNSEREVLNNMDDSLSSCEHTCESSLIGADLSKEDKDVLIGFCYMGCTQSLIEVMANMR